MGHELENALSVKNAMITDRFAALLGKHVARREIYDQPLFECEEWVAAPTLGAIVPNWLIVVPRDPVLNFRTWQEKSGKAPESIVAQLCAHLALPKDEVIWFEHGPTILGSVVGCGADYAHLHILLRPSFSFQSFLERSISMSNLEWKQTNSDSTYDAVPAQASYLVAGCGDNTAWTSDVEAVGSQFFRRVVGSLSDRAVGWDYKQFPHADNIAQTMATFRAFESTALRGR